MNAVLTYHSIDDSGSPISVRRDAFQSHIRWLASGRVRPVSLDALARGLPGVGDAVAVTFDDGFLNIRDGVRELLSIGVPVTIFAVTGHVGGTNAWGGRDQPGIPTLPLLGWDDLADLRSRGASIEAHTRTHPALRRLSDEEIDAEWRGCRDDLHAQLGVVSRHVAYPYGDVDDRVAARTGQALDGAFGYTTEMQTLGADDPLRMPRLDMYYFRSQGDTEGWGSASFRRRLSWIRVRRRLRRLLVRQ